MFLSKVGLKMHLVLMHKRKKSSVFKSYIQGSDDEEEQEEEDEEGSR